MKKIKLDTTVMSSENLAAAFVGACEAGDEKMVEIMLPWVKRTDVNCSDRMGVTALMAALAKDQYEVGGTLLDLPGLDFSLRDIQGKTVLDYLLQSKSSFFFDEIVEEMENILPHEEFNNVLLKKLKECLPELKENLTMFKRVLAWYDVSFRNSELFTQAMKAGGDSIILAFQLIYPEDIPDKLSQDALVAIATAVAAGHTALIGLVLYSHEMVDMVELLSLCREKGVPEYSINKELYKALSLMLYKISPPTYMGYVWEFNMDTFKLGLNLMDINYLDKNGVSGPMGLTILMRVLKNFHMHIFWIEGVKIVKEILMKKELDLSVMNKNEETALDLIDVYDNYDLTPVQDLRLKSSRKLIEGDLGSQKPRCLLPVVNVVKFEKTIDHIKSTWALDIQLLCLFKKRQESFKDFDFNDVKQTLLSKAIKSCRMDLIRFLLINCNVKVLQCDVEAWSWLCSLEIKDRDWCEVRNVLSKVIEKIALEDSPVIKVVGSQPG